MSLREEYIPNSSKPWKPATLTVLLFFLFYLWGNSLVEGIDLRWMDTSLRWRRDLGLTEALAEQIQIVEVDDRDLAEFGMDGEYAATAATIRRLAKLGARAIIVDVLYSRGAAEQQQLIQDAIEEAKAAYGTRFVLPAMIYHQGERAGIRKSLALAKGDEAGMGIINMEIDPDRLWRRYALTHVFEGQTYPSLALAAYAATFPPDMGFAPAAGAGVLEWSELSDDFTACVIRRAGPEPRLLNFRDTYFSSKVDKKAGMGRRIWNVRDFNELRPDAGTLSSSPFQGAVAFFGYGRGLDEKATSMGPQEPGVFLHAIALSDLIQGSFLRRANLWQDFLLMALVAAAAIALFQVKKKRWLFAWAAAGLGVIIGGSLCLIWFARFVPGTMAASGLWLLLIFVEIGRRHSVELVERIRLNTTMGFYFSRRVLKHVRANPGSTDPREADLTLLLTDINNFTNLCEQLPPKEMFDLLSHAFGIQTKAAIMHDGSLQHFWGDQFLAYWGAPEPQPDAADRALKATRVLTRRLDSFRHDLPRHIAGLFDFGVGLHCGPGLVGNMGSGDYHDYSVFGDVVNSTARLEALTKTYGVRVLATRQFCDALSSPPLVRTVDHVYVVGKKDEPLEIIQISLGENSDSFQNLAARYGEAFTLYQAGNFENAERLFLSIKEEFDDSPAEVLAKRCRQMRESPPDEWNGIHRFGKKDADG